MEIKTSDDAGADLGVRRGACGVCHKVEGRYACPKCNLRYCSSDCYKSDRHGACSESFYKAEFMVRNT